jgi:hypothetical protein
MDYIKAQQEILAASLTDTPRMVLYFHREAEKTTTFYHPSGFYAYVIPDQLVAVNLGKCKPLDRCPIPVCPTEEEKEITATGVMVEKDKKRILLEFKNRDGVYSYFDKQLLAKFGKGARLYQEKPLSTATITDGQQTVGYLCPVNHKREPAQS